MEHSEMEQRISDWITGAIEFTEDDRVLDEVTGAPLRLGLFSRGPLNRMTFTLYILGFTVVDDLRGTPYLIVIGGFEDNNGQRFTFPFHVGELFNKYAIIDVRKSEGRRINQGIKLFFQSLTPYEVAEMTKDLVDRVSLSSTEVDDVERTGQTEIKYPLQYYKAAENTILDLVTFLDCNVCSLDNFPESIRNYTNKLPKIFERTIPYLSDFRVNYWK